MEIERFVFLHSQNKILRGGKTVLFLSTRMPQTSILANESTEQIKAAILFSESRVRKERRHETSSIVDSHDRSQPIGPNEEAENWNFILS